MPLALPLQTLKATHAPSAPELGFLSTAWNVLPLNVASTPPPFSATRCHAPPSAPKIDASFWVGEPTRAPSGRARGTASDRSTFPEHAALNPFAPSDDVHDCAPSWLVNDHSPPSPIGMTPRSSAAGVCVVVMEVEPLALSQLVADAGVVTYVSDLPWAWTENFVSVTMTTAVEGEPLVGVMMTSHVPEMLLTFSSPQESVGSVPPSGRSPLEPPEEDEEPPDDDELVEEVVDPAHPNAKRRATEAPRREARLSICVP
jgi:hypothetical protein